MTAQSNNQGRSLGNAPDELPGNMSAGALLRAHADSELDGATVQTAAVQKLLTDPSAARAAGVENASARVEFERALKPACSRCLCKGIAPASSDLRARVTQAMATAADFHESEREPVTHAARGVQESAERVPGRAGAGRGRRWMTSVGATAILAFAAVAVYQAVINTGTITDPQASFTAQLASFVSDEHRRTAVDTPEARAKFGCTDFTKVCDEVSPTLGQSPDLPVLGGEEDLAFQGASRCGVPGGGPSVHIRFYTRHGGEGHEHQVSLFVQRGAQRLDLEEGRVYSLECPKADVCVWREGELVYYLVSDDAHGCECFRAALGVGEPTGVVRLK